MEKDSDRMILKLLMWFRGGCMVLLSALLVFDVGRLMERSSWWSLTYHLGLAFFGVVALHHNLAKYLEAWELLNATELESV